MLSAALRRPSLFRLALPAVAVVAGGASASFAVDVYSLGDSGASLLKYSTSDPGTVTHIPLSGGSTSAGSFLDSIDSRPATGQLYGYLSAVNEYYTVNTTTGALTKVSASTVGPAATSLSNGLDFNPTIDRARVVSDAGDNIVFNPTTGTTTSATNLFYVAGDPNAGVTPSVIDNAYTNSYLGATTTQQYALDYGTHSLVTLNNNTGELTTVAAVTLNGSTINFDNLAGIDIYTDAAKNNIAYALLYNGQSDGLYTINLASGAATLIGVVNDAAFPDTYGVAVVPEPTSIAAIAGLGVLAARRRR